MDMFEMYDQLTDRQKVDLQDESKRRSCRELRERLLELRTGYLPAGQEFGDREQHFTASPEKQVTTTESAAHA